ncbi:hypothetical protein BDN67DRAFT_992640 [Paxillus ammoniavirescens]|nr:hypothetical protein BDN67DRAFT_992640 [Paxillus ammoniavirescens]
MIKLNESINRVFLLRFDSGHEAIVRFPTPLAGPPHFTTASEVATIDFLRRRLGFSIPRVLAWSSRAEGTDVGAEFILMEKASGCLLSDVWGDLPRREQGMFAKTLGEWERQLLELKFTHYGSLYYKDDVPAPLRAPTLLEGISPDDELNSQFCIGPIARRDFWEAERGGMDIDRGPWRTAEDYMTASARREQEWLRRFGTSHILDDPDRVLPGQGTREDHVAFLSAYITLAPFLIPPLREQVMPVMWHLDLHASDIFGTISPKIPLSISSVIGWQGTCIGPAFLQLQVPPLYRMDGVLPGCRPPALPDNFEELGESERADATESRRRDLDHKLFELAAFPRSISDLKARQERVYLENLARATWKYGLLPFRTCPLAPPSELAMIQAHHDQWSQYQSMLEDLEREFGLGEFGYVKGDRDQFERVRSAVEQKKQEYINGGKDDKVKRVRALLWPYRDTLRDRDVIPLLMLPCVIAEADIPA